MQAELGDDAVDGAFADAEVALAEFLRDDLGAGFGIEEAMTNHLADQFWGAPVVGLGAAFGTEETEAALLPKAGAQLEIALAAETKLGGGLRNAFRTAFALDEHGQFTGDFIIGGNGERAGKALEAFGGQVEGKHGDLRRKVSEYVQLNMAQLWGKVQGGNDP